MEMCVPLTPGDEPACFLGPVLLPPEMFFATFLSFCSKSLQMMPLGILHRGLTSLSVPLHREGAFDARCRWMGLRWGHRGSSGGPPGGVSPRGQAEGVPPRCPPAPGARSPQAGPARGRRRLPPPFPLPLPWQPSPW